MKHFIAIFIIFMILNSVLAQKSVPIQISLGDIVYENGISQTDKEKCIKYFSGFSSLIRYTLDSLANNFNHSFKQMQDENTTFLFLPIVKKSKNEREVYKLYLYLYHQNKVHQDYFNIGISNNQIDENNTILLYHFKTILCNTYNMYIPPISVDNVEVKSIKNDDKKSLNLLLSANKKDKNNVLHNLIAHFFLHKKQNIDFNFYLGKSTSNKNLVNVSYVLKEDGENYVFNLVFKGKNIILKYPSGKSIETSFKLDKKRFDAGDYSEFGYLVMPCISSFIIMNK